MCIRDSKYCECMEREELKKLQSQRLIEAVERVYYNVPYYRNLMQERGLMPEDIKGIEDLDVYKRQGLRSPQLRLLLSMR